MNQGFRDPLRAFTDADARFLVIGAYAVAVIGRDALIENKRQLGRTPDLADLELLARHPRRG